MTGQGGDTSFIVALRKSMTACFPAVLAELIQEAVTENPDFKKIARIMGLDPALSATVISLVNSPFYGLTQEVHTLERAAVVLGNREILKLVLAVSFQSKFTEQLKKSGEDVYSNWSLIAWSATAAHLLAPYLCPGQEDRAYLCTLLKDISLLLMCAQFPDKIPVYGNGAPLLAYHPGQLELEEQNWGLHHGQLSFALLRDWGFPPSLCEAVPHHHDYNSQDSFDPFTQTVILATRWAEVEYHAQSNPGLLIQFQSQLAMILGITESQLDELRSECIHQFQALSRTLMQDRFSQQEQRIYDLPMETIQSSFFLSLDIQDAREGLGSVASILGRHMRINFNLDDWELALRIVNSRKWAFYKSKEGRLIRMKKEYENLKEVPWSRGQRAFQLHNSSKELGEIRVPEDQFNQDLAKELGLYLRFFSLSFRDYLERQAALELKAKTLDTLPLGVAWLNEKGEIRSTNKQMLRFLKAGKPLLGRNFWEILSDARGIKDREWGGFLQDPSQEKFNRIYCPLDFTTEAAEACLYLTAHRSELDKRRGILVLMEDISEITDLQTQAIRQMEFLKNLLQSMQDIVLTLDRSGEITYASDDMARNLVGKNFFKITKPMGIFIDSWNEELLENGEGPVQVNLFLAKDEIKPLEVVFTPLSRGEGTYMVVGRDLSTILRLEEKLKRQAIYDHLTGVFNRHQFHIFLDREVERSRREPERILGLLFFDVDGLKKINDEHGHAAGDVILKDMGRIMRQIFRKGMDYPCRFGGDEFVVLVTGAPSKQILHDMGNRLLAMAKKHFKGQVGVSIGIAVLREGEGGDEMLNRADEVCYQAKLKGGHQIIWAE